METGMFRRSAVVAVFTMLVLAVTLVSATYAWFTTSNRVSTSRVTARSGSDSVELQISSAGGADFQAVNGAGITQVNHADLETLLPVSTADLETFFYCANLTEGSALYREVEDEQSFFHGRIYLRAVARDRTSGQMAVYLDETSLGPLATAVGGQLLNAARLGLVFNGENRRIFFLSPENNAASDQIRNTWVNGALVPDGNVLAGRNGSVRAVPDPAVAISECSVEWEGGEFRLPEEPLCLLELNEICPVDIYFYLEGCDPDCSEAVSFHAADLALAFYGILR